MTTVRVDVKLYATLRCFAPEGTEIGESFPVEIDDGTVKQVLSKLGISEERAKIIMVNGVRVKDADAPLKEGDLLVVFPPVGGG